MSGNGTHGKNVILISLQPDLDTIGLKSLHACLWKRGFNSVLLYLPDIQAGEMGRINAVCTFVRARSPLFVGIGLMSLEFFRAAALTGRLKEALPDVPVIWGGIHPTMAPEDCLAHADFVCAGEGESTVVALAAALAAGKDIQGIHNLRYFKGGVLVENPLAPLVDDIDALPAPSHVPENAYVLHGNEVLPLNRKLFGRYARWGGTVYSIMGSRGCPFACTYCCNNTLAGLYQTRRVRRRAVAGIIAELERAVRENPGIRSVSFQDDCFLACTDAYLESFCEAYERNVRLPFVVRLIPEFLTEKKLRMLKRAGLAWVFAGLQSGNDETHREIFRRPATAADFLKAAELIHRHRVAAVYDVITDNPFENDAQRLRTVRRIMDVPKPFFIEIFSLTFYPGTELYDMGRLRCPEAVEDCRAKDYFNYRKTNLNHMLRMAAYLDRRIMKRLVNAWRRSPQSIGFKARMAFWKIVSAFLYEPAAYVRMIYRSEGGDILKTLKSLPLYIRQVMGRYTGQF